MSIFVLLERVRVLLEGAFSLWIFLIKFLQTKVDVKMYEPFVKSNSRIKYFTNNTC